MLRRLVAVVGLVALAGPASAGGAVPLTLRKAKIVTRDATTPLAQFLDAKATKIATCHRLRVDRIDCTARIDGAQQTCLFRVAVIRVPGAYMVHGRDLRCQPRS